MSMTRRQKQVLDFISATIEEKGYAPSYQEIMVHLGLHSKSGVHRLIMGLRERGLVHQRANFARTVRPVEYDGSERWQNLLACARRMTAMPTWRGLAELEKAVNSFDVVTYPTRYIRTVPTLKEMERAAS